MKYQDAEPRAYLYTHMAESAPDCKLWPFGATTGGYGRVYLDRRPFYVHVLACEFAHGRRPDGMLATHGPCHDRLCLNWAHLNWGTGDENMADKHRDGTALISATLTPAQVLEIRSRVASGGVTYPQLAAEYGVHKRQIGKIVNRQAWAWL